MIQMIKYQIEWKMINSLSAGADSINAAPPTVHTFEQQWFKMRFNTDEILGNEPTAHLQSLSPLVRWLLPWQNQGTKLDSCSFWSLNNAF